MSDRHPSEELDIPGEMASESNKPNKKGLKLQLNVREAVKHNQHVWKQQQQQQQLLTPGSSRGTPKRKTLSTLCYSNCKGLSIPDVGLWLFDTNWVVSTRNNF